MRERVLGYGYAKNLYVQSIVTHMSSEHLSFFRMPREKKNRHEEYAACTRSYHISYIRVSLLFSNYHYCSMGTKNPIDVNRPPTPGTDFTQQRSESFPSAFLGK